MISIANTAKPWGLMDIDNVWKFRNKDACSYTEIDDVRVSIPQLRDSLIENGLNNPLVLRIYLENNKASIRLEEGNHRIMVLYTMMEQVPVIVHLASSPIGNLGNGYHLYNLNREYLQQNIFDLECGYYAPDQIFKT